ncbi:hypothetical protein [Chryseobacterium binzhouense]|uniref:hypothetical protein n=1 Tax=Chryseobacterium binzhouense TaxID=2593646 RepID=UPI001180ED8A|nr:hypothetical protein [Chryseobacterium binzhouense]
MNALRKLVLIITMIQFSPSFSQVIIGDATGTAPANQKQSVLLEFADTNNKGIIMPYVRTLPANPAPGTILLDASVPTSAAMKFYDGTEWKALSGKADVTSSLTDQPTITEEPNSKAIIGNNTSSADGVLVLESTTKAMILPIVTDVQNIVDPSPGMIVYVKGTQKYLAAYDGNKWAFWIP